MAYRTQREWALEKARELLGPEAVVRYFRSEVEPEWRYRIYRNPEDSKGKQTESYGHGSSWVEALKYAALRKSGLFYYELGNP